MAFACDIEGTQRDQRTLGPAITVLGNSIDTNGGVVPADGVIQLSFDRYLLPATITRQSFLILDNTNTPLENAAIRTLYDPIARTVTIVGPDGPGRQWLTPEQSYKLVLLVPRDPTSDLGGFRAIDRAPLHEGQKLELVFRAGPSAHEALFEPAVDFCADVLPIFHTKCGGPSCHGPSSRAASSLVLSTSEGVRVTARGRIAQGSNTAASATRPESTPSLFGANMEIIKPGDPGSSWLLYKVELARTPVVDAGPAPDVFCTPPEGAPAVPAPAPPFTTLAPARTSADEVERAILNDYVTGREMPYPYLPSTYVPPPPTATEPHPSAYAYTALDFQERERIRIWIARGAAIRECGGCGVREPDAGSP
ncbi:MAG: hypothetical protein KF764_17775 [Labilithrix sp.]|nr:hypothetical protein [Labilithrix sp.]